MTRSTASSLTASLFGGLVLLFVATLFGLLAMAGCSQFSETWEWNQKLSVEVRTPEGVLSGAAVSQVVWQELNSVGNYPSSYRGEATIVDLGSRGMLFALLGEDTKYIALRAFSKDLGENYSITEKGFAATARLRGTREVPREYYPLLVSFTDINDPKTVKKVDPDDLSATFGAGVSLKRMTLEITDEATMGGKARLMLRWLTTIGDGMLDGRRTSMLRAESRLANGLSRLNFERY